MHDMKHHYLPAASRNAGDAEITNILTSEDDPDLSLAHGALDGEHGPTRNSRSARYYYIITGSGRFTVEDKAFIAEAGSVVRVPAGHQHQIEGSLTYIVINRPAFDPKHEST